MKFGVIISTNDPETCWNALRFANYSLSKGHEVKVFFLGKGVEYQMIGTNAFNTVEQAEKFTDSGGIIFACGSCIKSRGKEGNEMCPLSTMEDMYNVVMDSDKIVTF
jgi:uncharacterized protein involved in oxidation of intracellular sulfur